jgi:murein L,D-transpeptidase YafK
MKEIILKLKKPIFWAFFMYTICSFYNCSGQNERKIKNNDSAVIKQSLVSSEKIKIDTVKPDLTFKKLQLKNKNPQIAYQEKEKVVKQLIIDNKIDYSSFEVLFRVIKQEQILEVWARDRIGNDKFKLIKTYSLCVTKNPDTLRGIDLLVPESFYYIAKFHPDNPYFIRMEINFPNESDKKRGRSGSDIAIHGGCFSTYCTPFTDEDIKEIYIFAAEAKAKGQKNIPVYNFPYRMTDENTEKYKKDKRYSNDTKRITNWDNMKYGFQFFEKNKTLFNYTVDEKGKYLYKD